MPLNGFRWLRPELNCIAIILAFGSISMILLGHHGAQHEMSEAVRFAAEGEEEQEIAEPDARIMKKLIPDQRALFGSPDTLIDLKDVFAETEIGKHGDALKIEIKASKKDVAKASIEGTVLRLEWGDNTKKKREILIRATAPDGKYVDTKFRVQVWKPDYLKLIMAVLGGLGIFLLGMKHLSDGMQAIAGDRLRRLIGMATDNRFMATGVGVGVTFFVQSSSITTVMVVGFVNSGFMTLAQSLGVIMGANIGTTITGWILWLKIGKYGLLITGVAAFIYLFSKLDRLRFVALTFIGLGMVFLGLELMKDGFGIIKELPAFEAWFQKFNANSYFGVLKCAAVGCVLTFIVQSSSATLGITIGLAEIGVIRFETAAALVMGENIGTTITAWLASFGANVHAKRAAYFHVLFNLIGVAWITIAFPVFLKIVRYSVMGDASADMTLGVVSGKEITAGIAAAHTGFNVTNTVAFFAFAGYIAKFLERTVPDRGEAPKEGHLTNLQSSRFVDSPSVGLEQSRAVILGMADGCSTLMGTLRQCMEADVPANDQLKEVFKGEAEQDDIQHEIVAFMSNLLSGNIPHDAVEEARSQLRLTDEYESVSDCIASVLKARRHLMRHETAFSADERQALLELHDMVASHLKMVNEALHERNRDVLPDVTVDADAITKQAKQLAKRMISDGAATQPRVSVSFNRAVSAYRRIRDHVQNIAETVAGQK